jgi:hypothetical protein
MALAILDAAMTKRVAQYMGPGAFSSPLRAICVRARDMNIRIIVEKYYRALEDIQSDPEVLGAMRDLDTDACELICFAVEARSRVGCECVINSASAVDFELPDRSSARGYVLSCALIESAHAQWSEGLFIAIACISALAPHQQEEVSQSLLRAMLISMRENWHEGCAITLGAMVERAGFGVRAGSMRPIIIMLARAGYARGYAMVRDVLRTRADYVVRTRECCREIFIIAISSLRDFARDWLREIGDDDRAIDDFERACGAT